METRNEGSNPSLSALNLLDTMAELKLRFQSHHLPLAHTFTLAHSSRTHTPITFVQLQWGTYVGYGEAAMPPYLGESAETVESFYSSLDFSWVTSPSDLEKILNYVHSHRSANPAAKAAIDIALHDLHAKRLGIPVHDLFGLDPRDTPPSSYTIGIHPLDVVHSLLPNTDLFGLIKVKLGGDHDRDTIDLIRNYTDKPISVDVNQGWTHKEKALEEIHWLKERGVVYVEQPMPKETIEDMQWLSQHSPLPTIADEAVQRLSDLFDLQNRFHGVNIKLMKCTGLREGYLMAKVAKSLGLKVMIGCMTESSCGIAAAAQLAPLADWVDLDGHFLLAKDPFEGLGFEDGVVQLGESEGLGVYPKYLSWDDQ